ncbi:hypothetical protein M422DRAFT_56527 [Sphaerobolus stellatus SS14]|uniref:Uncharacterized protein n=1 Tax=Sphaerobolus stellatus (strain SS14) TaxID=990650 RepID=A0A0C9UFX9_SPHS4|nr:hypothetical protein M422DRAFT_56527 [Sphaerobolus stellatus SS14]
MPGKTSEADIPAEVPEAGPSTAPMEGGLCSATDGEEQGNYMEDEDFVYSEYIRSSSPAFGDLVEDYLLDNEDIGITSEDSPESSIIFSEAELLDLDRRWNALMAEARNAKGVHPKFGRVLKRVFTKVHKVGGDVDENRPCSSTPRRKHRDPR